MPNGPWPLASSLARLAFGTLAVVAMTYQFAVLNVEPGYAKGNFFSFVTIQSNILAVAALFLLVAVPHARRTALFDRARQIRRGAPLEQPASRSRSRSARPHSSGSGTGARESEHPHQARVSGVTLRRPWSTVPSAS